MTLAFVLADGGCKATQDVVVHKADLDAFRAVAGHGAPEHRVDTRQQLAGREGLGDVIVGAAFQPGDLVGFLGARRQQDHRQLAGFAVSLQGAREFQAAGVRKHPVDQQHVGAPVGDFGAGGPGVGGLAHFEARAAQAEGDHLADRAFILDDQDLFRGHVSLHA